MDNLEILKEAKARQAAGDARELAVIVQEIDAELKAVESALAPPAPNPGDVIGFRHLVMPSGDVISEEIKAT